jgi:hypothetical protein
MTDAAWSRFDTATLDPGAQSYTGALFDGARVYFVPYNGHFVDRAYLGSGLIPRVNAALPFDAAASWALFDVATVDATAVGFRGGGFDGRFLYLAPNANGQTPSSIVARHDTTTAFGAGWSFFDTRTLSPPTAGFWGTGYDGRYMYFVPSIDDSGPHGKVVRFDTEAPFAESASWTVFDVSSIDPAANWFAGAVFDGRHVYFVPSSGSVVARFEARCPAAMPAWYSGSFY